MRDQYAGDVSDVLKFALLRTLTGTDKTLGIAWYYAPGDDGRPDGRHLEWRNEPAWYELDETLHSGISVLPERSIAALQNSNIWPSRCFFFAEPLPPDSERANWNARKCAALEKADIVFLDPDNGLGDDLKKHATYEEINQLRRLNRSVVFISFPPRVSHSIVLERLHSKLMLQARSVITLRTSVAVPTLKNPRSYVPRARWFTIVDPDEALLSRTRTFAHRLACIPRVKISIHHDQV